MPRHRHDAHILELAKRGAEAQFRDLVQEIRYLIDLFPHLRDSYDKEELPLSFILAKGSGRVTRTSAAKRQKRRMSAAARKKISEAQKKRWAAKRKATAKA
jgi:hypothetical protein